MNDDTRQTSPGLLLPVFIITLICSVIIFITHKFTSERIEYNEQLATMRMIEAVMPLAHDNDLYQDKIEVAELSTTVYRARKEGQSVGLVFMPIVARGYSGEILLTMGVSYDGVLCGVRVMEQHETDGLGALIDQDKSNWILGFNDRSLENTDEKKWAVKKDGGDFDQISGATITPRSVINIVYKVLEYYSENRDSFYEDK